MVVWIQWRGSESDGENKRVLYGFWSWPSSKLALAARGAPLPVLTLVCVESADAGFFLHRVPQFHGSVSGAGQEAVLDAAVSQSPHGVRMPRPRTRQDAWVWSTQEKNEQRGLFY